MTAVDEVALVDTWRSSYRTYGYSPPDDEFASDKEQVLVHPLKIASVSFGFIRQKRSFNERSLLKAVRTADASAELATVRVYSLKYHPGHEKRGQQQLVKYVSKGTNTISDDMVTTQACFQGMMQAWTATFTTECAKPDVRHLFHGGGVKEST